jgi:ribosomal protein S18 acetylase RimI-like enzyme
MIEIRRLREDDGLEDLISLSREFFEEYESHHQDFFKIDSLSEGDIVDYFSRSMDSEDGEAFIALAGGRIVGYITVYVRTQPGFWKIKKVGGISGLMVQQAYRRRGIAGQLLARARAFFQERGVRYFTVYTAVANRSALAFYEQSGLLPLYTTMMGEIDLTKIGDCDTM